MESIINFLRIHPHVCFGDNADHDLKLFPTLHLNGWPKSVPAWTLEKLCARPPHLSSKVRSYMRCVFRPVFLEELVLLTLAAVPHIAPCETLSPVLHQPIPAIPPSFEELSSAEGRLDTFGVARVLLSRFRLAGC